MFIGRGRGHGMWAELMGWVEQVGVNDVGEGGGSAQRR